MERARPRHERDEPDRPRRRRHPWVWPVALGLLVLIGLAVGGVWFWNASAARGLDTAIAELRRAGEPVTLADLAAPPVSADRNAAPDLRAAARLINTKSDEWKAATDATRLPFTDVERAAWRSVTDANRDALARVRAASTQKDAFDWAIPLRSPLIQMLVPDYNQQRELARLLHGAALVAHEERHNREALARAGEVLFVGRGSDHLPTPVSHLVSLGIRALGCDAVIQVSTDLDVEPDGVAGGHPRADTGTGAATRAQVHALIAELLHDDEPHAGLRRALRNERVEFFDALDAILQGRMGAPAGAAGAAPTGIGAFLGRPMFRRNGEAMARHVTALMGALDAPDWPTFSRRTSAESAALASPTRSQFLVAMIAPSLQRMIEMSFRYDADRRMAAVALAVRLYALDHGGQLPATLDELVPTYLPSVPRDPLAAGDKPLGYVADPDRPRIYNVGANGVDDGGNDPDPSLSRSEWTHIADDVRYLKRQPRPAQGAGDQ